MINIKHVSDPPKDMDGVRILIDRLWPKGVIREEAKISIWLKDLAPSEMLKKWFGHDAKKWREFKKRYFSELKDRQKQLTIIRAKARFEGVTLLSNTKKLEYDHATALKEYLESHLK